MCSASPRESRRPVGDRDAKRLVMNQGAGAAVAVKCGCRRLHLTTRQIEVLRLAAAGLSSKQIATRLRISQRTVDDHLAVLRQHARAADRGELIARCYAAEILVGWPPDWSGKRCLPVGQGSVCRPNLNDIELAAATLRPRAHGRVYAQDLVGPAGSADAARRPEGQVRRRMRNLLGTFDRVEHPRGAVSESSEPVLGSGEQIGYAWVCAHEQSLERQLEALTAVGCRVIFADDDPSKTAERATLCSLLGHRHPGDTLVVTSLDRVSRSVEDLMWLSAELRRRCVGFKSLHELLDTSIPGGWLVFHVFDAIAEFLHELIPDGGNMPLQYRASNGRRGVGEGQ